MDVLERAGISRMDARPKLPALPLQGNRSLQKAIDKSLANSFDGVKRKRSLAGVCFFANVLLEKNSAS